MEPITLDYSKSLGFLIQNEIDGLEERVNLCHDMLHNATGQGSDYWDGSICLITMTEKSLPGLKLVQRK